jgi:hypothetical protein
MTQPLDLDPIRQRLAATTAGLWWNDGHEIYAGPTDIPAASVWIGETCNIDLPDGGNANGTFIAAAKQDVSALIARVCELQAENARLTKDYAAEERLHAQTIAERDYAHAMADRLAQMIATEDVTGEHTGMNDPWQNTLDLWKGLTSEGSSSLADEVERLRAELAKYVGYEPTVAEEMAELKRGFFAAHEVCDAAARDAGRGTNVPRWVAAVRAALDGTTTA